MRRISLADFGLKKGFSESDLPTFCILVAGIPPDKLVEAHGTFASATCTVCRRSYPGEDFRVSDGTAGAKSQEYLKNIC